MLNQTLIRENISQNSPKSKKKTQKISRMQSYEGINVLDPIEPSQHNHDVNFRERLENLILFLSTDKDILLFENK